MMTATSTEQRTESSWAFLNRPPFRLRKVTELRQGQWQCAGSSTGAGSSIPIAVVADGLDLSWNARVSAQRAAGGCVASLPTSILRRPMVFVCQCVWHPRIATARAQAQPSRTQQQRSEPGVSDQRSGAPRLRARVDTARNRPTPNNSPILRSQLAGRARTGQKGRPATLWMTLVGFLGRVRVWCSYFKRSGRAPL
jgi:hypothetical protein